MSGNQKRRTSGFTLIEILTVLAIVLLLSAVSFAAFSRVREKGRGTVCLGNLRQIALAMQQYTQDSGGYFPPVTTVIQEGGATRTVKWQALIQPWLKDETVFHCPTSRLVDDSDYAYNRLRLNRVVWSPDRNPRFSKYAGLHESEPQAAANVPLNFDNVTVSMDGAGVNGGYIEASLAGPWLAICIPAAPIPHSSMAM